MAASGHKDTAEAAAAAAVLASQADAEKAAAEAFRNWDPDTGTYKDDGEQAGETKGVGKSAPEKADASQPSDDKNPHVAYKKLLALNFAEHYLTELPENLRASFTRALGAPASATVKTMAAIPAAVAEQCFLNATVVEEGATETTNCSGFQKGLLNAPLRQMAEDIADLKSQKDSFDGFVAKATAVAPPAVTSQPGAPGPSSGPGPIQHVHTVTITPDDQRTLLFSEFLSSNAHGRFTLLNNDKLGRLRAQYKQAKGTEPSDERRPTDEQLSALYWHMDAMPGGIKLPPYVDLAIWGAWGKWTQEARAAAPRTLLANGDWQPHRSRGPRNLAEWLKAWNVFEAAMLMLGAASPGSLERYREGIENLADWYRHVPGAWAAISAADKQVRLEQWPRMLEQGLSSDPPHVRRPEPAGATSSAIRPGGQATRASSPDGGIRI